MDPAFWDGSIDFETPAGLLLKKLVSLLPRERRFEITVFGSAPIQITVDSALTSGDVDLFSEHEEIDAIVKKNGLGTGQTEYCIQVCSELNFRTTPRWKDRTRSIQIENCTFIFPHPIDILIAKLNRLDEKDFRAFEVVRAKTGHPTEAELIHELQMAVDLFRPSFDEEQGQDVGNNCQRLWPRFFGREIDVRKEIIAPALAIRKAGFAEPTRDYKQELREIGSSYTVKAAPARQ